MREQWCLLQRFWKQSTESGEVLSCTDASLQRFIDTKATSKTAISRQQNLILNHTGFPGGTDINDLPCTRQTEAWAPIRVSVDHGKLAHIFFWGQLKRMDNAQRECRFPASCHSDKPGTSHCCISSCERPVLSSPLRYTIAQVFAV